MKTLKIQVNGKTVKKIEYAEPTFKGINFDSIEYAHNLAKKFIAESKVHEYLIAMLRHQVFVSVE